jgi:ribosomal-protein-alanine N-acetyltransferase
VLLGFAVLTINQDEADIVSICVGERYRRLGIATKLLAYSCHTNNIKTLFIEVSESNEIALSFYRKVGFVQVGTRKNYSNNEEAIVMKLEVI